MCVYMLTKYGDDKSFDNYMLITVFLESMLLDYVQNKFVIIDNFNCSKNSRFYNVIMDMANKQHMTVCDKARLQNMATYLGHNGSKY